MTSIVSEESLVTHTTHNTQHTHTHAHAHTHTQSNNFNLEKKCPKIDTHTHNTHTHLPLLSQTISNVTSDFENRTKPKRGGRCLSHFPRGAGGLKALAAAEDRARGRGDRQGARPYDCSRASFSLCACRALLCVSGATGDSAGGTHVALASREAVKVVGGVLNESSTGALKEESLFGVLLMAVVLVVAAAVVVVVVVVS